jgi:NADP-dependent 3-hydroxy acid dehydrogenase YdfG
MTTATATSTMQRERELLGQTVVVIGGSAGIGLETARRARAEGADVILTGRNPGRLERAAHELGALSGTAFDAAAPDRLATSTSISGGRSTWPARRPAVGRQLVQPTDAR